MRRGPGIVALDRSAYSAAQYSNLFNELNSAKLQELRDQIDRFSRLLRAFAVSHRHAIRQDPEFRHAFQRMCSSLWVDPLAGHPATVASSSRLGKVGDLWNDLIGFGDWQYELGVQVVDVCISTRARNGGIISMSDLIAGVMRLRQSRFAQSPARDSDAESRITSEDVQRSIHALQPLGCGYELFALHGVCMVRTVPRDLSTNTLSVLAYISSSSVRQRDARGVPFLELADMLSARNAAFFSTDSGASWSPARAEKVLEDMLFDDGTLWLDIEPADLDRRPEQKRRRYYTMSRTERDA
ncbi:ESCRT II complex subunit Dot2 [Malassezia sp. CBS 17886]|nr:ESCRT II complex subunit Dot2 [Malassezia sp. CBS 17886]